jgi:hypothetical protein
VSAYTIIPSSVTSLNKATYSNLPASNTSLNQATYTNLPTSGAFSPTSIANLELWLDATTVSGNDGDAIGTWVKSGGTSGTDAVQATAARKPILKKGANGINNLAILRFDGTDDYMLATLDAGSVGFTVFLVGRTGSATSAYTVVLGSGGGAGSDNKTSGIYWGFAYETGATFGAGWAGVTATVDFGAVSGIAANQTFRSRYSYDKVTWDVSGPNTSSHADTSFPTGTFQAHVGTDATSGGGVTVSGPWKGDTGEIIVYSRGLTAGEISSVDAYLLAKWGI